MRTFAALLTIAATLLAAGAAEAKPEKGKVFDDWVIDCETQAPGAAQEVCFAAQTQTQKSADGKVAALLKVNIGYIGPKGEPALLVLMPLGIFLPAGPAMKIDEQEQLPLAVQRCVPQGCIAGRPLDDKALKSLRDAKQVLVGFAMAPDAPVRIKLSTKGLDAAVKSLK